MTRFDGTAARQLDLIDFGDERLTTPSVRPAPRAVGPNIKLLKEDVYAEILRRRRKAQIAARHLVEKS